MTLHEASRRGEAEVIRDLVHERADIEARDDEGRTPLLIAAEAGHVAAVRALIEAGADVNAPVLPPGDDSNEPPTGPILAVVCRRGLIDRIWPILGGQLTVRGRRKGNQDGPSPLMTAAAAGHAGIVAMLRGAGADVKRTDRDGFTALAYAAAFGRDEIVDTLIQSGADLNTVDHHGMRPVGIAALLGQVGAVRTLAEAGSDLTSAANDAYSPLQAAAQYGHVEAVRILLAASADPEEKIFDRTPLDLALREGHADIVALLAVGGADLEQRDGRGLTPLLIAVARGDRAALRHLLAAGVDLNRALTGGKRSEGFGPQALPQGATALHLAACREEPECVADLLAAGADPQWQDSLGFTPLALALATGDVKAADLLRSAAPPTEDEIPVLRAYELIAAVRRGDELAVRASLAAGADPRATIPDTFKYHYLLRCELRDNFGDFDPSRDRGPGTFGDAGRSALALAIERGHESIAAVLLAAGASTEGTAGSRLGRKETIPLGVAAEKGPRELVQSLLTAGANVEEADPNGQTPIFRAAEAGHADIVRDLIAAGARVDLKDHNRQTPLELAAQGGNPDCVRALLDAGATPRPRDLTNAALHGHVETAIVLLDALKVRNIEPEPKTLGSAVFSKKIDLVRHLLEAGVDPSRHDSSDLSPLEWACESGIEMVRLLLDAGADLNATRPQGPSIRSGIFSGGPDVLRLLLERGADPDGRIGDASKRETALITLSGQGLKSHWTWTRNPDFQTRAWAHGLEMVRILIAHGADLEARDEAGGRTALMHAAEEAREDIVRVLLEAGAKVDARDDRDSRTALHWAAHAGRTGAARLLIAAGADVLAEDADGLTPEDLARRGRHETLARELHAQAADRPRPGKSLTGRLCKAVEAGDVDAIRTLVDAGADVNARLSGGKTPLLIAVEQGYTQAVEMLLAAGADPNKRDADDLTPLMAAIEANRLEFVRLLLAAGADPDAGAPTHRSDERRTPLLVVIDNASDAVPAGADAEDESLARKVPLAMIRALIDAGADVNLADDDGSQPLWYALDVHEPEIAEILLAAGAGGDEVSAAYLKARELSRAARSPEFLSQAGAFAAHYDVESQPLIGHPSSRDFRNPDRLGRFPLGPTIGAQFETTRAVSEAILADQENWRRRGVFPVRTEAYRMTRDDDSFGGFDFDGDTQKIGLLPTDDPYVAIAALCAPGTDFGWVCPAFTIRDLRSLEADFPFRLIGCSSHWLELEFTTPIADPAELVRRLLTIRMTLGVTGLSEYPEEEELMEYFGSHARIGFYWE
ncbi:ankyrin repeat domain-containing protein [Aquisphaera insulae]|uniref:ankyrin repeat domain-containing protein n=1 Tax=Aquisphaera insulae TaxID=2712864 RepID=UPI0013EDF7BC|nr:ankyrin repeat domain-containing protein [Aquisphaera insulae]